VSSSWGEPEKPKAQIGDDDDEDQSSGSEAGYSDNE